MSKYLTLSLVTLGLFATPSFAQTAGSEESTHPATSQDIEGTNKTTGANASLGGKTTDPAKSTKQTRDKHKAKKQQGANKENKEQDMQ